jgi:hypothetical protein
MMTRFGLERANAMNALLLLGRPIAAGWRSSPWDDSYHHLSLTGSSYCRP